MDNTKEIPYLKAWNVTVKDDYKPYLIVTKRVKVRTCHPFGRIDEIAGVFRQPQYLSKRSFVRAADLEGSILADIAALTLTRFVTIRYTPAISSIRPNG
jgi:hypothetical protein